MGARILIAEDEANIVEAVSFILRRDGHVVAAVADGEAALAQVRSPEPPQVLILDVMLPGRNGFEVLKAIRADERLRKLRVIMLTARAQAHDRATAERMGADAYVTKPFANRDIVELVRRLARD